jgi:hypothetical protein
MGSASEAATPAGASTDGQRSPPLRRGPATDRFLGMSQPPEVNPYAPPVEVSSSVAPSAQPLFLYIPTTRLIVLSIVSMSLYEAYWIYKNWQYIKVRDNLPIRPIARGVFGVFYCHRLLTRMYRDAESRAVQVPAFSPSNLATGWVVLMILSNLVSRAPGVVPTILAAFIPSFLCLVPVQRYVNAVTRKRTPDAAYHGWSAGHIFCLVIGILLWAFLLLGAMAGT